MCTCTGHGLIVVRHVHVVQFCTFLVYMYDEDGKDQKCREEDAVRTGYPGRGV